MPYMQPAPWADSPGDGFSLCIWEPSVICWWWNVQAGTGVEVFRLQPAGREVLALLKVMCAVVVMSLSSEHFCARQGRPPLPNGVTILLEV